MAKVELSKESLATLLREAEKAHGLYERRLGHRDDDWPTWYAACIMDRLQQTDPSAARVV